MKRTLCLIAALLITSASLPAVEPLWTIGKPDGLGIEFAPGSRGDLTFTVGQNAVSRDFAGHQDGSVGFDGKTNERSYTIVFDLPDGPAKNCELVLDLIFNTGGPQQFKVRINDRVGVFPVRLAPKHTMWGEQGNDMLLAQAKVVVPIEAAWLKAKGNQLVLAPLGLGSLQYDAITLREEACAPNAGVSLEPTIFFR